MPHHVRFLTFLGLFTVFLAGTMWVIFTCLLHQPAGLSCYLLFLYFYSLTALIHLYLVKTGKNKDPKRFVPSFMGIVGLKMFLSLAYLFAYIAIVQTNIVPFAVSFLVLYFVYTTVEVMALLRVLKKHKETPS